MAFRQCVCVPCAAQKRGCRCERMCTTPVLPGVSVGVSIGDSICVSPAACLAASLMAQQLPHPLYPPSYPALSCCRTSSRTLPGGRCEPIFERPSLARPLEMPASTRIRKSQTPLTVLKGQRLPPNLGSESGKSRHFRLSKSHSHRPLSAPGASALLRAYALMP